jgi:very-short-patch-repair endonuclease
MKPRRIVLGARVSKEKLEIARGLRRVMTLPERRLWERLRARRLGGIHFRRQQVIRGFIVDFYCHAAGLAIEIDGDGHRNQTDYDQARDHRLSEIDVRVIRFQNEDVLVRIDAVVSSILEACLFPRLPAENSEEGST